MTDYLTEQLKNYFGYPSFRQGQREAVEAALNGEHTLVMLPTGTGKTLCYALTGKLLNQLTIIVSPLLSLMQDQVNGMKRMGINRVAAITSMQNKNEKRTILNHLDQYEFIYMSPEMLNNEHVLKALNKQNIGLFVVDEAHCISQWGMDFRPEYLQLGDVRKALGEPLTMSLTATATEDVREEISHYLFEANESVREIVYSVDRKNIAYHVERCTGNKKEKLLEYANYLKKPGIIYFSSKKQADEMAELLDQKTTNHVVSYHGDLDHLDRTKIQANFLAGDIDIICATSAFGMGVNKNDIRFVIHYHLPGSPEEYLQEVGRAGRDGNKSLAILLYEKGDESIQNYFIDSSLPSKATLDWIYQGNQATNGEENINGYRLAEHFYQAQIPIDEANQQVRERFNYRKNRLQIMIAYTGISTCYRSYLLNYFNENIKDKVNKCCSNDEKTLVSWYLDSENIIVKQNNSRNLHWRDILEKLF